MNNGTITTLIVKHLPDFITTSPELRERYFKPYNPIDVRFMQSQAMIGFVFLDFPNRSLAEKAFELLAKINFGLHYKQVTVEYAKPDPNRQHTSMLPLNMTIGQQEQAAEPVSATHGLMYPSNPQLRYYYPDPTPDILTNITHAIATVPRFYTQVLHLMNKYNMPPPFGPAEKDGIPSFLKRKHDQSLASDESELEDDEQEEKDQDITEEKVKQARLLRMAAEKQKLALRKQSFPSTSSTTHAPNKKIKISIGLTAEQQALRKQCKPISELLDLPAFKNYEEGTPSSKLYIKNLDKQATQQELIDLYSNFSKDVNVNLMTKGRLRGQAFVGFKDKSEASVALQCTNGYVIHGRPLSVQYGKESTSSSSSHSVQ
ncbi:Lipase_3 domain-containing protein [Mucor velutinosus]|uniref:Lipase_3 domain-containing protein n=1 Tax=Mucor velutinosus TaxID=708070 RepID=A0AAN7DSN6_9FUNG|nr:Lipase_3 domain-containing protein [Mucor velutinosus]